MYNVIGYYICEHIKPPQFLCTLSNAMLSVSNCFECVHPKLDLCFFENNKIIEKEEYLKKWNLCGNKLSQLMNKIATLFGKRLNTDGMFTHLSDAQYFYNTYFSDRNCTIVSLSTTKYFIDILKNEISCNCKLDIDYANIDENELIGFDILGWDIGGFHSFLCNSLQEDLPSAKFNRWLLLQNTFDEIKDFSNQIQGLGEPVEWIPFRLGKCNIN